MLLGSTVGVFYLQVETWQGNNIEPAEQGWVLYKRKNKHVLQPVRIEQDAAPPSLLKVIRCNCTGKCDRNTCSCRKNGLLCTLACGHCKGNTCANGQRHNEVDGSDGNESDDDYSEIMYNISFIIFIIPSDSKTLQVTLTLN